jgi:hypothetical protein
MPDRLLFAIKEHCQAEPAQTTPSVKRASHLSAEPQAMVSL